MEGVCPLPVLILKKMLKKIYSFTLILTLGNSIILSQQTPKFHNVNVQTNLGYCTYNSKEGVFLSIDHRFTLNNNINILNNLFFSHGEEKQDFFNPEFSNANWNLGLGYNLSIFKITTFNIDAGLASSWFSNSYITREIKIDQRTFPVSSNYSVLTLGYFFSLGYNIHVSKNVILGVMAGATYLNKEKKYMKYLGLSCGISCSSK